MNLFDIPWLEMALLIPLVGAAWVSRVKNRVVAAWWCLGFTGATLICTFIVWLGQRLGYAPSSKWDLTPRLIGQSWLGVDELSAPLLPLVTLLHFLVVLATTRTKMQRVSFSMLLLGNFLRLLSFACLNSWMLVLLLALNTVPPFFELVRRGQPTRVYVLHMGLFVVLLVLGWAAVDEDIPVPRSWAAVLLFAALLVRCGVVPFHVWVTDLFEKASFGTALLNVTPLAGVYAAVRLVLPVAPDWVLEGLGMVSLLTAVYGAGMAVVQQDARRFYAFLFLNNTSLILVGLELHTVVSLTGSLALWIALALSLGGLGLTLRAIEARVGRLTLTGYRGLYDHSPSLAVCFLLTGLASVGFPGTLGFVASEVLVDGAIGANLMVGLGVVLTAALNGIAIIRVYFLIFTGGKHSTGVPLGITGRERFAVLTLAALILGGGLLPYPYISSRHRAAESVLIARETHAPPRP